MENCVDVIQYGASKLLVIKEPGSVRHQVSGAAQKRIEMRLEEAVPLYWQLLHILEVEGLIEK